MGEKNARRQAPEEVPLKSRPPLKRGPALVGVPPEAPTAAHIYFTFIIKMNLKYVKYIDFDFKPKAK